VETHIAGGIWITDATPSITLGMGAPVDPSVTDTTGTPKYPKFPWWDWMSEAVHTRLSHPRTARQCSWPREPQGNVLTPYLSSTVRGA